MILGGISIGFFMAYLQLFTHEAAHHNIAPSRRSNDLLANALLAVWVGQDIAQYRKVHFAHHRFLGEVRDPERSYFYAPSWRLLVETLLFAHVLRIFRTHAEADKGPPAARWRQLSQFVVGVGLNIVVVLIAWRTYGWPAAGSWVLGMLCFFPTFGTWRQLLEHRRPDANAAVDYGQIAHGAYTRTFGTSFLERMFGGAGFNRHLLHHWVPQVSYTRFDDLERIMIAATDTREVIEARRSGYLHTLASLWAAKQKDPGS